MSKKLPKLKHPIFSVELPSTGEKVNYRTFTVKEEKILLLAQEAKDVEQALLSIQQVVNNCLVDTEVEKLSMFDLEFMLLTLRAKSVDNKVLFTIKDPDTEETVELELDLDEVKIVRDEKHTDQIKLDDENILYMRYPTISEYGMLLKAGMEDGEANYKIMKKCMDKLVSGEEVYLFEEFSDEDMEEFIDDLSSSVIEQLKVFFQTMPKLRHEMKYTNSEGAEKTFVIEGMETFFT